MLSIYRDQRTLQQVLDRSASLDSTLGESAPEVEEEVVEEEEQEEAVGEKGTRNHHSASNQYSF